MRWWLNRPWPTCRVSSAGSPAPEAAITILPSPRASSISVARSSSARRVVTGAKTRAPPNPPEKQQSSITISCVDAISSRCLASSSRPMQVSRSGPASTGTSRWSSVPCPENDITTRSSAAASTLSRSRAALIPEAVASAFRRNVTSSAPLSTKSDPNATASAFAHERRAIGAEYRSIPMNRPLNTAPPSTSYRHHQSPGIRHLQAIASYLSRQTDGLRTTNGSNEPDLPAVAQRSPLVADGICMTEGHAQLADPAHGGVVPPVPTPRRCRCGVDGDHVDLAERFLVPPEMRSSSLATHNCAQCRWCRRRGRRGIRTRAGRRGAPRVPGVWNVCSMEAKTGSCARRNSRPRRPRASRSLVRGRRSVVAVVTAVDAVAISALVAAPSSPVPTTRARLYGGHDSAYSRHGRCLKDTPAADRPHPR